MDDVELLDAISAWPNIEIGWPEFEVNALRGSPLSKPSSDPASGTLFGERDRLLDEKDLLLAQAEFTEPSVIDPQLQCIEQKLLELDLQEERSNRERASDP